MSSSLDRSREKIKRWRHEPKVFAWETFKIDLDHWQAEGLEYCGGSYQPRRRLVMKACTGPGKSTELGIIGWHRLVCFGGRGRHPKGAALSGEGRDNLRDNLWAELAKWRERSPFLMAAFEMNQSRIAARDHKATWFLAARSYPKSANKEQIGSALSGLHSEFPFLLLDEIGNMPIVVGQKASQIFTGGVIDGIIAAAGNPTSTSGLLYELCQRQRHLWKVLTITADPDDPKRTKRVPIDHAREQIKLFGRDNPWVMATILGLFPPQGFNKLLSLEDVEAAMERAYRDDDIQYSQKRLGIDCARFGDDATVIFPRQGLVAYKPVVMRNARGPEIAARVAMAKTKWGSEVETFDDTGGWASSAIDSMIQAGYSPQAVNVSSRKTLDPRYYNRRAEIHWALAEWVKRGGQLPYDEHLIAELTEPEYSFQDGKIIIEPKEFIKERLGRSPDKADALSLTFAIPEMPAEIALPFQELNTRKVRHEYDPLDR